MGFVRKKYNINSSIKATKFLLQLGYSKSQAQRIVDKGRLRQYGCVLQKSSMIASGEVEVVEFVGKDLGLLSSVVVDNGSIIYHISYKNLSGNYTDIKSKPICISNSEHDIAKHNVHYAESIAKPTNKYFPSFCIFNKPAKILTHPKNNDINNQDLSLLDQLRYSYGKNCNPCHRLDYETSGLVLCALDKSSEVELKNLFLRRSITKEYLAIVHGRLEKPVLIQSQIIFSNKSGNLCVKGRAEGLDVYYLDKRVEDIMNTLQNGNAEDSMRDFIMSNNINLPRDYIASMTSKHAISLCFPIRQFDSCLLYSFLKSRFGRKIFSDNIFNANIAKLTTHIESSKSNQLESYMRFRDEIFSNCNKDFSFSLVRLVAFTGRTHQLRIHTSAIHHGIIGDVLYGVPNYIASFFLDSKIIKDMLYDSCTPGAFVKWQNCYKPHNDDIFDKFLAYCSSLPCHYRQILDDMRTYYTGSIRLLLHAYAFNLFGKRFTT